MSFEVGKHGDLDFHWVALFRSSWLYFRFSLQLNFKFVPPPKKDKHGDFSLD